MAKIGKFLPLIGAVLIGLLFQQMFIYLDKKDTPSKAATAFAQAYYMLDGQTLMERLCTRSGNPELVDNYLYHVAREAAQRGFGPDYVKSRIFHIQTRTIEQSDNTAKVRIVGKRRNSINPVYAYVASLFCLTKVYEVDGVLNLVKEKGRWKVCDSGAGFSLM